MSTQTLPSHAVANGIAEVNGHVGHTADDYPYDLGTHGFPIRTSSPVAQEWFNRGLMWKYGFNTEEAQRCFAKVLEADPDCALAHWAVAWANAPDVNISWEKMPPEAIAAKLAKCYDSSRAAARLATDSKEKALVEALVVRFPQKEPADVPTYKSWDRAYADAMREVYKQYGSDLEIVSLYAESCMILTPFRYRDLYTGEPTPDSRTAEIQPVVEEALARPGAQDHPALLHFFIHLSELSKTPEVAIPSADRLRSLCPDIGHMNHMPGHIYLLIGDWRQAIDVNLQAAKGDAKYTAYNGSAPSYWHAYMTHNLAFVIYAAMFSGQYAIAIDAVERVEKIATRELLEYNNLIRFFEFINEYRIHVLVRFGKWEEILQLPFPDDPQFYQSTTATTHYARTVALSVLGRIPEADAEFALFRKARAAVDPTRRKEANKVDDIMAIAEAMAIGELEYRKGNYEVAFASLREASRLSDGLIYREPWSWMQPPRHAYAALQLEQGNAAEAAQAYAEDLGLVDSIPRPSWHPNNVWALHGYYECLKQLGRHAEARLIKGQLDVALASADVSIESSCFCRRKAPAGQSASCCD